MCDERGLVSEREVAGIHAHSHPNTMVRGMMQVNCEPTERYFSEIIGLVVPDDGFRS
jgi:hypothetical protein